MLIQMVCICILILMVCIHKMESMDERDCIRIQVQSVVCSCILELVGQDKMENSEQTWVLYKMVMVHSTVVTSVYQLVPQYTLILLLKVVL